LFYATILHKLTYLLTYHAIGKIITDFRPKPQPVLIRLLCNLSLVILSYVPILKRSQNSNLYKYNATQSKHKHCFNYTNCNLFNVNCTNVNKIYSLIAEIQKFKKSNLKTLVSNMWTPIAYWNSWTNKQVRESSLHRLQFVRKMAAVFTDTSTQSNTSMSDCSVDDVLTEVTPFFD